MEIEFDPLKDAANIAKHGLSLADAGEIDSPNAAVIPDRRRDYGEPRWLAFDRIEGEG